MQSSMTNAYFIALMGKPDILNCYGRCVICGAPATNKHHIVPRSAGKLFDARGREITKPLALLCGNGNTSGCHGLAHQKRLHFRYVERQMEQTFRHEKPRALYGATTGGHWEYLVTDTPTKYENALELDGWQRVSRRKFEEDY